jgi:hypothetical protein
MHADAFHATGARHAVGQDYALAGVGVAGPFAVVSDGCSGAADSDVGARLVALAAAEQLRETGTVSVERAAARAGEMVAALGLSRGCLDATLLAIWLEGDQIRVVVAGDGAVVALADGRAPDLWVVSADDAPPYPSYWLDEGRLRSYLARHGRRQIERYSGALLLERRHEASGAAFTLSLSAARHRAVIVTSDGASSFRDREGRRVATPRIAAELGAFATTAGRFVVRRCRRFLGRTCRERGWRHDDDLAAAAIHLGERS